MDKKTTRCYPVLAAAIIFCATSQAVAQCGVGEAEVTIAVTTDAFGFDTYWQLVPGGNPCGIGTIFTGGNFNMGCNTGGWNTQTSGGYAGNTTITEGPWCLNTGEVFDIISIDDGGNVQASFEVIVDGSSVATFQDAGPRSAFSFAAQPPVARDLSVVDLQAPLYRNLGQSFPVRGTVQTFGTTVVNSFDLNYSVDGGAPVVQSISGLNLQMGERYLFEHATPWVPAATGSYSLSVWASNVNGASDLNTVNDAANSTHVISEPRPNIIDDILAVPVPVVMEIANSNQDILVPRDLAFHPELARNELWVLNKDTEASGSSTVKFTGAGTMAQTHLWQEDPNNWHFMSLSTALAFGDNGNFATAPGVFDANHNGGSPFTGISLWSSDPAIYAQNLFGPLGSHLDMLHVNPNAQGIAHERWNRYWVVDGYNQDVVMNDFMQDHGPGFSWHGDAVIRRYSGMTITRDPNDHIVSHCELDPNSNWLYVVDHGGDRLLRLDITTGSPNGAPAFGPFEPYVEYTQMVGETWEVVANTGLVEPAGLAIVDDRLLVSDHATGEIVVYDLSAPGIPEIGRIATNSPGIMGIEVGPDGAIWAVNATTHQLLKIAHTVSVEVGDNSISAPRLQVYPVPTNDRLSCVGATPNDRLLVIDPAGRAVIEVLTGPSGQADIDVAALAPGEYVLCDRTRRVNQRFAIVR